MGFGRALTLFLAIQIYGFIGHRTVLHKDCTKGNDRRKGKIWRMSNSTGCMIEYGKSYYSKTKQYETSNFSDVPSILKILLFPMIFHN